MTKPGSPSYSPLVVGLLVLLLAGFSSCRNSGSLEMVPEDARVVMILDFKNLAFNTLDLSTLLSRRDNPAGSMPGRQTLESSGIDLLGKAVAFQLADSHGSGKYYFIIPIREKGDFFRFLQQQDPSAAATRSQEMDWMASQKWLFGFRDGLAVGVYDPFLSEDSRARNFLRDLFSVPEESRLSRKKYSFRKLISKGFDAACWMELKGQSELDRIPLVRGIPLPEGEIAGTLDFEEGVIEVRGSYMNPDTTAFPWGKILGGAVEADFLHSLPDPAPAGLAALRLDLPAFQKAMVKTDMYQMGILSLTPMGINPDEIFQALEGQFALTTSPSYNQDRRDPDIGFSCTVSNPDLAESLLKKLSDRGILQPRERNRFRIPSLPDYQVELEDKVLSLSPFPVLTRPSASGSSAIALPKGPLVGYAGFEKMAAMIPAENSDHPGLGQWAKLWESASLSVRPGDGSTTDFQFRLKSKTPEKNSMETFLTFFSQLKRSHYIPFPEEAEQGPSARLPKENP